MRFTNPNLFTRIGLMLLMAAAISTGAWAQTVDQLDRGHKILLKKGLQLQGLIRGDDNPYPGIDRWRESKFTTFNIQHGYERFLESAPVGTLWSRWGPDVPLIHPLEMPFLANLVSHQVLDEQDMGDPNNVAQATSVFAEMRANYPDVINFTNQAGGQTDDPNEISLFRTYMQTAQPDMVIFDAYPWAGSGFLGGSPTPLYKWWKIYRDLGVGGLDGTGNRPIPYGFWQQVYIPPQNGYITSESEIRLDYFAPFAFGYTFLAAFIYNQCDGYYSSLFTGNGWYGDDNTTASFGRVAEANRQSLNLGPALIRLVNTDVRLVLGLHWGSTDTPVTNDLPPGMTAWDNNTDPYIKSISATNLGSSNFGLRGDVLVGYFKPLADFDGTGHTNEIYFMIVNGLTATSSPATGQAQTIHITFDFGGSGITSLQRLSRDTGLVETVSLTPVGGSAYSCDITLDGGTGDLFKFNTGVPFVGPEVVTEPSAVALLAQNFDNDTLGGNAGWSAGSGTGFSRTVVDTATTGTNPSWYHPAPGNCLDLGHPASSGYNAAYKEFAPTSANPPLIRASFDAKWVIGPTTPYFGYSFQIGSYVQQGYLHDLAAFILVGNQVYNGGPGVGFFARDNDFNTIPIVPFVPSLSAVTVENNWWHIDVLLHYPARTYDVTVTQLTGGYSGTVTGVPFYQNSALTPDQIGGVWFDNRDVPNDTPYDLFIDNMKVEALQPATSGMLNGTIQLQDYRGDVGVLVQVELRQGGSPVRTDNVTVGGPGTFTLSDITPGTYDVAFKSCSWLRKVVPGVSVTAGQSLNLGPILLISGDRDGNNAINSNDLSTLLANMDLAGDL